MVSVIWESNSNPSLQDYTLILPDISVGNVGQLAVDLLLNNLKVDFIAYLHHPCFLPIAGADPFNPDSQRLSTSCQMYECKEKKLVIIQHRAPIVSSRLSEYLAFLVSFIKEQSIRNTVMLSSSFSQHFTYEAICGVPLHYLLVGNSGIKETFQELSWRPYKPLNIEDKAQPSDIPGAGFAALFIRKCASENIPLVLLILVCSEGDNYPEAYQMATNLSNWLHLKEDDPQNLQWKMPFSWRMPYGSEAPNHVY